MAGEEPDTTGNRPAPPVDRRRRVRVAACLLVAAGLLDVLAGIATIPMDPYFDVGAQGTHHLDITGWGWLHLAIGVVTALGGIAAAADRHWTAVLAIAAASASIGVNILLFPYHPLVAILAVALEVTAIPLLARHMRTGQPEPVEAQRV